MRILKPLNEAVRSITLRLNVTSSGGEQNG